MPHGTSTRSERAIVTGQKVAKAIVKEPVKEAVREALIEERLHDASEGDERGSDADRSEDGVHGLLNPKVLLPLSLLAAVAIFAKRRGEVTSIGRTERPVDRDSEAGSSDIDQGVDEEAAPRS